jgi:hypothetical protein
VSDQDPRTNTSAETLKDIEDKERNDEENRSSKPHRKTIKNWLSKLQYKNGCAGVAELLQKP